MGTSQKRVDLYQNLQILEKNGFKVSKYPSSINNIIQRRIKKEKVLNQPVELETFVDFGMEMIRS